jgi:hypothetical protein
VKIVFVSQATSSYWGLCVILHLSIGSFWFTHEIVFFQEDSITRENFVIKFRQQSLIGRENRYYHKNLRTVDDCSNKYLRSNVVWISVVFVLIYLNLPQPQHRSQILMRSVPLMSEYLIIWLFIPHKRDVLMFYVK